MHHTINVVIKSASISPIISKFKVNGFLLNTVKLQSFEFVWMDKISAQIGNKGHEEIEQKMKPKAHICFSVYS